MASARAHVQEFANLPAYTGPGLPTKARNTISELTDLAAEEYIRTLDVNVKACKKSSAGECRHTSSDLRRPPLRLHVHSDTSAWLCVLDQDCGNICCPEWQAAKFLLEGTLSDVKSGIR